MGELTALDYKHNGWVCGVNPLLVDDDSDGITVLSTATMVGEFSQQQPKCRVGVYIDLPGSLLLFSVLWILKVFRPRFCVPS